MVAVPEECPHGVTNTCQVIIIIILMKMVIVIKIPEKMRKIVFVIFEKQTQGQPCGPGRICLPNGRGGDSHQNFTKMS